MIEVEPKDLTKLTDEGRNVVNLAQRLGWTARWATTQKRIVELIPPEDVEARVIRVPTTNINHKRLRSIARMVVRHAGRERVMAAIEDESIAEMATRGMSPEEAREVRAAVERKRHPIPRPPLPVEVVNTMVKEVDEAVEQARAVTSLPEKVRVPDKVVDEVVDDLLSDGVERHVVSRKPAGAKAGVGVVYESEYVTAITYSDGLVIYQCSEPGCHYTRSKVRAVATHAWQAHGSKRRPLDDPAHTTGEHPDVSHRETPPEPRTIMPDGTALAQFLEEFIQKEVKRATAEMVEDFERRIRELQQQKEIADAMLIACQEQAERYRSDMVAIHDMLGYVVEEVR
jgi:hypothetical protein